MSDPDYARLAADALKRRAAEARPREVSRDHGIGVIAQAMAERRRKRSVRTFVAGALALSAAAAAVWVGIAPRATTVAAGGNVRVESQGGSVSEHKLAHGQSVVAGQGRSTVVEFETGTRITLREQGELVYREDTQVQRFGLVRGAAHLVVAKLSKGQRFVVDTEEAEVEVRGTVFDVAVQRGPASCPRKTLVSVTEGAVEVRSRGAKLVLSPGQKWESACAPALAEIATEASQAATPKPKAVALAPEPVAAERPVAAADDAASKENAESPLVVQNNLYAEATAARQSGDFARALAGYDRLLDRFPRGPLAESANVERIRILKRTDLERARAVARRHLDRYRDGFASAELRALLEKP